MANSSSDNLDNKVDILTEQVGRLTEGLTDFRMRMEASVEEFRSDLAEIKLTIKEQAEVSKRQAESSIRQAETADRLARVVETLIQQKISRE